MLNKVPTWLSGSWNSSRSVPEMNSFRRMRWTQRSYRRTKGLSRTKDLRLEILQNPHPLLSLSLSAPILLIRKIAKQAILVEVFGLLRCGSRNNFGHNCSDGLEMPASSEWSRAGHLTGHWATDLKRKTWQVSEFRILFSKKY